MITNIFFCGEFFIVSKYILLMAFILQKNVPFIEYVSVYIH